ncbi:LOW QUALITY PROTEIN: TBC1 domain family member 2A [Cololabis saira]|uniref:LOW QUALITY PROTEIN: TBC1 domain family member 2A n=1 Tax=Cololabis saira TaxID=129043 RepID=UPI002AD206A3|nr:LOW QUALITY PROTEIN: TBC1 domain family member 2A [Cololabis saira]
MEAAGSPIAASSGLLPVQPEPDTSPGKPEPEPDTGPERPEPDTGPEIPEPDTGPEIPEPDTGPEIPEPDTGPGRPDQTNLEPSKPPEPQAPSGSVCRDQKELAGPPGPEPFCGSGPSPVPGTGPAPGPRLCGFLQKQGGPLRAWKRRWFSYEENQNQLFYFRTPQDVEPLGRVELSAASFSYPLGAEPGTFHVQTPERTFVLKAVTRELMLYWLQQLQVKRWQHRRTDTCIGHAPDTCTGHAPDTCTGHAPDTCSSTGDFLLTMETPLGLVGEGAASAPPRGGGGLANMSIKHPLIHIQNSVHSLKKRRSVFPAETPPRTPPRTPPPSRPAEAPPPPLPLADPAEGGASPLSGRRTKTRRSSVTPEQEKLMLVEEVKAQKELVLILHRALEAAQLEKRSCAEFLAEDGEQRRLELLRHGQRQAANAQQRLEDAAVEAANAQRRLEDAAAEAGLLRAGLADRDARLADRDARLARLQEEVRDLRDQNQAQQQVIQKLSDQVTSGLSEPVRSPVPTRSPARSPLPTRSPARSPLPTRSRSPVGSGLPDLQVAPAAGGRPEGDVSGLWCWYRDQELGSGSGSGSETLVLRRGTSPGSGSVLQDDLEAYQTQNRFLNSEIFQLTRLWRKSSETEKSLMVKCSHLESSLCQVESRYLGVLRKLQEDKSLDRSQQEAVQRTIEDVLGGTMETGVPPKTAVPLDHDQYGFKILPDYEVEDMKLLAKIQALEIRSHNLRLQQGPERPLLARWARFLAGRSDQDLSPSPELKALLRGGVPPEYRPRIWRWLVRTRTRTLRERHPQRYQQLCEQTRSSLHPASHQIQLDLHRTLTTNQHFSSPSSPALQQLRRVLLAFSWHNAAVGYCQGLNRLAALALLVLQDEEDSFWLLVAVVEALLPPGYYAPPLLGAQADQRVLKDLLEEKLPRLAAHLQARDVDVTLVSLGWFLVVFVENLASDLLLPLWDAFLYEGSKVLFRYALAIFKYKQDELLRLSDGVEIYQYLRCCTRTISDGRKLAAIAFGDMNPFPRRLLRTRRTAHLQVLQAELQVQEEQQKELGLDLDLDLDLDKDLGTGASEDDDDL